MLISIVFPNYRNNQHDEGDHQIYEDRYQPTKFHAHIRRMSITGVNSKMRNDNELYCIKND